MSEYQVVGHCPKCGCPIYQAVFWAGTGYPPVEYSCLCYIDAETPKKENKKLPCWLYDQ